MSKVELVQAFETFAQIRDDTQTCHGGLGICPTAVMCLDRPVSTRTALERIGTIAEQHGDA